MNLQKADTTIELEQESYIEKKSTHRYWKV